ncbi:MAG: NOP5/NOP56 family protein [Candidatus Hodarchaeales archaeon]
MKYAFISPLGYGIVDLDSHEDSLVIEWNKFQGNPQEQAEKYYKINSMGDYNDFKAILPKKVGIQVDQRNLWDRIDSEDKEIYSIVYEPISQNLRQKIYSQFTEEEKKSLDAITQLIGNLSVQKKESRDVFLQQAINALDDLTEMINLMHNRLKEFYGVHFPELGEYIKDTSQYFRLVNIIGDRESIWPDLNISDRKNTRIKQFSEASLGTQIAPEDLGPIKDLAKFSLQLIKTRNELEEYIENASLVIMPNVTRLVGPLISARLLSHAGSLETLSRFPSSTIQLLGAEKALFRHLKTGERPPKHGIIFQSPHIHQAPYHQRGRRARVLAGKISIAARLDYFIGEDQGTGLEEDVERRIKYISEKYAKPPKRKKDKRPDKKVKKDRRYKSDRKKKEKYVSGRERKRRDRKKRGSYRND